MKRFVAFVCICLIAGTACTRVAEVPPGSYEEVDIASDKTYRIETTDGEVYLSNEVARTDTAFVVGSLYTGGGAGPPTYESVDPPIVVPFGDVASFGARHLSVPRTAGMVVLGIVITAILIAGAAYAMSDVVVH